MRIGERDSNAAGIRVDADQRRDAERVDECPYVLSRRHRRESLSADDYAARDLPPSSLRELKSDRMLLDDEKEGRVRAYDLGVICEPRDRVPRRSHLRQVNDRSSVAHDEPTPDYAPARLDEAERSPPDSEHIRQRRERTIAVDLAPVLVGELRLMVVVEPPLGGADSMAKIVGRHLKGQQKAHESLGALAIERQATNVVPEEDVPSVIIDAVGPM